MIRVIRRLMGWVLRLLIGFRAYNTEVLSAPGPVLLAPNHSSWLDWLLLGIVLEEDWKFVVSRTSAETSWLHRKIMLNSRTFPIDTDSPYGVKQLAGFLQKKGRLVLFAEGRISRTGCLMKLFEGTGFLLHKSRAKVITCYLRGAHRLPLSPNRNRHFWFPTVTAHFSELLTPPQVEHMTISHSRNMLTTWLWDCMVRHQFETEMELGPSHIAAAIVETGRSWPGHVVLGDASAKTLTYRRLLAGARLMGDALDQRLGAGAQRVGVLLPNVNATPVALLALWSTGRVPALLNYSTGVATMLSCARLAGLSTIISSRAFIERAGLEISPLAEAGIRFIWLEDVRESIGAGRRLLGLVHTAVRPRSMVRHHPLAGDTAVILFTSGSEGAPKGVELSHLNVLTNVRQMLAVADLQDWDCLFNALPLFHSFGLTIGLLTPLVRGLRCFLYPSPLHYRQVPTTFYFSDSTILMATNTFLNGYARKGHPYDFRSLRYLFAGAEKVQESTARIWAEHFGVRILEGYGATECSPCLSVCTAMEPKAGSAGRFLPGVEYRVDRVEGIDSGGRLFVRGPNIMKGYLNPEPNEAFQKLGGWYDTGDVAHVDEDGFVQILGRMKRFAKISGEMVSLAAVEEALAGAFPQFGLRCQVAVVNRPDEHKGEALIAIANEHRLTLEQIRHVLRAKGFSNLCVPRELRHLHDLPLLGTGKVNHRELERWLREGA